MRAIRVARCEPSGCCGGLSTSGPLASSAARSILKKRTAFSLTSTSRLTIEIDDDDDLRRMLDERAIARLAVAQRRFRSLAIGRVAQADDVQRAPIQLRLADGDLGRKVRAVGMQTERLVRREVDLRVVETRSELFELRRQRLFVGELRQQETQRTADDLGFGMTEDALPGRVDRRDVARLIDGDDDVLDVIEDGLQLARGAFAQLARESGRLVRHQLHRAYDAATLVVGARVRGLDGSEQPARSSSPSGASASLICLSSSRCIVLSPDRKQAKSPHVSTGCPAS